MATLILLRHGRSDWNEKNLFTGWVDVDLIDKGREEAVRGGRLIKESGLLPDVVVVQAVRAWLAGTVAGGLAHVLVDPLSTTPLVGASAGISALMAAACRFVFQRPVVGYGDRPWQLPPRQPLESLPELLRNRTTVPGLP